MTGLDLVGPVNRFINDLNPELERIAAEAGVGKSGRNVTVTDVVQEAYNLAAAFIDVDGLHTDEELWSFVTAFAPHFDTMLQYARAGDVRRARLVAGKAVWLAQPSPLFEILLGDDHRKGTTNSWKYYEAAMAIAHTVCALDTHPAHVELDAVDRFRSMLLNKMENWEVPRPGTSRDGSPPTGEAVATLAPPRPLEELLAELDGLIGLEQVKAEVRLVANLIQVQKLRKERGLPVVESSRHLVFTGNPGTGKTTVARLLAEIYRTLEVVAKGHLVETDRSQLVAGYVGQTAIQVRKVVESALGGVLLIDEAYALARGDERDFGQEAIDTLVKLMEDHRDDVVIIAAGYPDEMATFVESNPGLRSRFPKTIRFPDYSDDELVAIFHSLCAKAAYKCTPDAETRVRAWFADQRRDKGFGNARLVRNLFEAAIARQASRVVSVQTLSDEVLVTLRAEDVSPVDAS